METLVTLKVSLVLRSMTEISTRDRIQQVAHDLLMKYGIRSITMDDIASGLGMSKKTIYQFFKDKDELVTAIVLTMISRNQGLCNADRERSGNAVHEMLLAMDMATEIVQSMNPSVLFDLQRYHQKAFQHFLAHKNDFLLSMIRHNIERGIREGLYRSGINVEVMARFRVESMFIPFNPDFVKHSGSSLVEIEKQVIIHFLYGLVTAKGYELVNGYLAESNIKHITPNKKQE